MSKTKTAISILLLANVLAWGFLSVGKSPCSHRFGKWSDVHSAGFMATYPWQSRTCTNCGWTEVHKIDLQ